MMLNINATFKSDTANIPYPSMTQITETKESRNLGAYVAVFLGQILLDFFLAMLSRRQEAYTALRCARN